MNEAGKCFTATAMCCVFEIRRQTYEAWLDREVRKAPIGERLVHEERAVVQKMCTFHADSRATYGVNRMTVCLKVWSPKPVSARCGTS